MTSGGGSTQVDIPPQLGSIGQTTSNLGSYESQFLGEPLSLGNYGITLATGGSVPQIASTGFSSNAQNNPAQYNLNTGTYWQGSSDTPNLTTGAGHSGTLGSSSIGQFGGTEFTAGQNTGGGVPTPTANVGGQNYYTGQTIQYGAGQSYTALYDAGGNRVGYRNADGNFVDSTPQLDSATPKQINVSQAGGPSSRMQGTQSVGGGGGGGGTGFNAGDYTTPSGVTLTAGQMQQLFTMSPQDRNAIMQSTGITQQDLAAYQQHMNAPGTTQTGGITTATQNPLYGPWLNSAVSAIAAEAGQAPSYEQMIAQAEGRSQQYYNTASQTQAESQPWLKQGRDIVTRGQNAFNLGGQMISKGGGIIDQGGGAFNQGQQMVTEATTGAGLFPSQKRYIDAQVKSGQAAIRQQLASEGLTSSTLGPELSAELGLQGAAEAGKLIQGNIAAGVSQEQAGVAQEQVGLGQQQVGVSQEQAGTGLINAGVGVAGVGLNLQQAAQGWAQLASGEEALGFGEQQALTGLFQNIASQNQGIQAQLWQEGLQGYGLEGAFLNSALSSYGTSLQAYNSILQGSEVQAQINEQLTASANAANSAIISSAISAVGQIAGGATKGLMCWVARAVFGMEDPRWLQFREWMIDKAPAWLRYRYMKHGPSWAKWISNRPIAKAIVRFIMNVIIKVYGRRR